MSSPKPVDFKWRHFHQEIILQCVRWYCKYGISYRDLEEMMRERGIAIDHTTFYRWVQHYAPELKKRLAWYNKRYANRWYLDETYIKVKGNTFIGRLMRKAIPLISIFLIVGTQNQRNVF